MFNDDDSPAPNHLFQTLQRSSTLANRVMHQIEQLIVEGHLQPGDRLPPERELGRQFGVSRTVIREAVRALVAKSLLEVRPGSGTMVRSPSAESVTQSMALLLRSGHPGMDYEKVLEIRRVLEVEIAGLAAQRRTPEDLEELEKIIEQASLTQGDRDGFVQCDVDFHAALAYATRNELFSLLLDSLADILITWRAITFDDVPEMPARSLKYHTAVLEQVKAGNSEAARQAMLEHLIESEITTREALARKAAALTETAGSEVTGQ